jgi:hypothetical protein
MMLHVPSLYSMAGTLRGLRHQPARGLAGRCGMHYSIHIICVPWQALFVDLGINLLADSMDDVACAFLYIP